MTYTTFNISLHCFAHTLMPHVARKALQDSVGMDEFYQMSDLHVRFGGLLVGLHMI
jgi:hypothetical protein